MIFGRSRLAAASVLLPSSEGLDQDVRRDVIQLLCSIFMANQGESEAAGEDEHVQLVRVACSHFSLALFFMLLIMFKHIFLPYLSMCWRVPHGIAWSSRITILGWEITDFL